MLQKGEIQLNYRTINLADFNCENENELFAQNGNITKKGFRNMWITISDAIHKADNQDRINLNKAKTKQIAAMMSNIPSQTTCTQIKDPVKPTPAAAQALPPLDQNLQKRNQTSLGH